MSQTKSLNLPSQPARTAIPSWNAVVSMGLGATAIAFAPILVKAVHTGPSTTGFYRCALGALVLAFLAYLPQTGQPKVTASISKRAWLRLFWTGLFFALDLYFWHRSVVTAGAGIATILANTQVFYLALLGVVFQKEALSGRLGLSILGAFLGVGLLVDINGTLQAEYQKGVGYGLLAGVCYAGFLIHLRRLESLSALPLLKKMALVSAFSAFFLLCFAVMDGESLRLVGIDFLWIGLLALIAQVLGWILIARNIPKVPVAIGGLILLTQPALATLMGVLIYQESMNLWQSLGACLILFGVYFGSLKSHEPTSRKIPRR